MPLTKHLGQFDIGWSDASDAAVDKALKAAVVKNGTSVAQVR